ncbi:MAG: hypothetical protein E2P02_27555 [Acidobacteria bacterium]|nr:MAG: hypothetical protein E2P02_27555 [Acidobacteriota bacterium]
MKIRSIVAFLAIVIASPVGAQKVEIALFYGYQFGDSFVVSRGEVKYDGSANRGFTLGVEIEDDLKFEFLYRRADTKLKFRELGGIGQETLFDMSVQYFHGGILYEVDASERVRGFFTGSAGVSYFDPESDFSGEWKFSFAGGVGVKVFMSDNIGIRLRGRLLFPVLGTSGGFGCGLPGRSFVGINAWSTISGDVTAGLIFAF